MKYRKSFSNYDRHHISR